MTVELYDALVAAGVEDVLAKKAASTVLSLEDKEQLATKADLIEAENKLLRWTVGLFLAQAAVFAGLVKLLVG